MRVVTCLPRLLAYADRFRMLCALSRKLECLHVLTTDEPTALSDLLSAHPNIRVVILPRKRFNRLAFDWVSERLRAKKLDIIHDNFGHFAPVFQAWGGSRSREYRFISTLYTNNWAWFNRVRSPHLDFGWSYIGQRIITLWRDRRICQHADRVLVLGPGHEDDLLDGHNLDTSRVRWVESEVNVTRFQAHDHKLSHPPTLLFTGAVCRNKGIDILLKALSSMTDLPYRLRLVGRILPWEQQWFEDAVKEADLGDKLVHVPQVPRAEMAEQYRGVHSLVFPSRFEGSPRSVREALASGIPAIVSDIAGHRGLDPAGHFLRFVDSFDPDSWSVSIREALNEPQFQHQERRRLGAAHMLKSHSFDAVAERLLENYKAILKQPPR
ncbi:MAG: glycosyltransferase family 4 protein [Myxococcota bacterium]|nr:glycosyltransferase family 4 protein [Myxococcota bacterium]